MVTPSARRRLVKAVRMLAVKNKQFIAKELARSKDLATPDFLWHVLLLSFSTMGGEWGKRGLIDNKDNYRRVTYDVLAKLAPAARETQVRRVCLTAGIRMPNKKADYILACFDRIKLLGGPTAATALLLAQPKRDGKILFLKQFRGIGDKYARNMMMDVYHKDFRESIALDVRILAVSQVLGLSFASYVEHELFYLGVAKDAGLNGWKLDRLLFNYRPEMEEMLGVNVTNGPARKSCS
jgi:hypothetical protein